VCFSYTYLTASDIKRIFNVCIHNEDETAFLDSNLSKLPRNPKSLFSTSVSKKELIDYLLLLDRK